jgi:hypothetical protein
MSAGSGASNLGYGNMKPLSNINGNYVNVDNSQYSGRFSSNEIPGRMSSSNHGLQGSKYNVDDASGTGLFKGGAKTLKKKIKNITKHYKRMKAGSRKMKSIKRKLRNRSTSRRLSRSFAKSRKSRKSRRKRSQLGGYAQYLNNSPSTGLYSTTGVNLHSSELALANPPPITSLSNCVNCVDNYNHYTNMGFPSNGH